MKVAVARQFGKGSVVEMLAGDLVEFVQSAAIVGRDLHPTERNVRETDWPWHPFETLSGAQRKTAKGPNSGLTGKYTHVY